MLGEIITMKKMINDPYQVVEETLGGILKAYPYHLDMPPKKESSYNVSKLGQKRGGINGKESLHSGANH